MPELTPNDWVAKWPNHCRNCKGWGLFYHQERHWFKGGGSETITDPCDELMIEVCHRCNTKGLSEEGDGPCKNCGWNYDDGMPEPDYNPED